MTSDNRPTSSTPSPEAVPVLNAAQLDTLVGYGSIRRAESDERLFGSETGDYRFFAIRSGRVRIVSETGGEWTILNTLGKGEFLGELSLLTGQRPFLCAEMEEAGEVIEIGPDVLRTIIATVPDLSDVIVTAFSAPIPVRLPFCATGTFSPNRRRTRLRPPSDSIWRSRTVRFWTLQSSVPDRADWRRRSMARRKAFPPS